MFSYFYHYSKKSSLTRFDWSFSLEFTVFFFFVAPPGGIQQLIFRFWAGKSSKAQGEGLMLACRPLAYS